MLLPAPMSRFLSMATIMEIVVFLMRVKPFSSDERANIKRRWALEFVDGFGS